MRPNAEQEEKPSSMWEVENRPLLEFLNEHRERLLNSVCARAKQWDLDGIRVMFHRLTVVIRLFHAVRQQLPQRRPTPTYLVDATFLADAFRQLTQGRDEALSYVTGPEQGDNVFVLSRLIPLQLAHRSLARARSDLGHQVQVLTKLEEDGLRLLGCLHSHPGHGPEATTPSSVDLRMQANLEAGGYAAIGGIFSRDGHLRFFSHERKFHVLVTGNKAVETGECLFRLDLDRIVRRGDSR